MNMREVRLFGEAGEEEQEEEWPEVEDPFCPEAS